MVDTVLEANGFPVNELGEIVLASGSGTREVVGTIPPDFFPVDSEQRLLAVFPPEIEEAVDTATEQALIATTQAGIATTKAGEAATSATAAATARTGAETARDAAYVNANVYADTTAGLAATADGQQFQVVSGSEIIRYTRTNSTTATEVARYPSAAGVQYAAGTLQEYAEDIASRVSFASYLSATAQEDDFTWTQTGTADCWFNIGLNWRQAGATTVDVLVQVVSGAFANTSSIDQRTSADAAISGTTLSLIDLGNGLWGAKGVVLDATFDHFRVRIKNTVGTTKFYAPSLRSSTQRVKAFNSNGNRAAAMLLPATAANAARNYFNTLNFVTTVTGAGGAGSMVGRTITVPYGSRVEWRFGNTDGLTAADSFMLVFKCDKPLRGNSTTIPPVQVSNSTGIAGGTVVAAGQSLLSLGQGWYCIRGNAAAASGANPVYQFATFDNRSAASGVVTISHLWVAKNASDLPSFVEVPRVLTDALTDAGVATAYVDPAGNDANTGSRSAPFATVAKAVAAGASRIYLRRSSTPHRHNGLSLAVHTSLLAYAEPGDTQEYAQLFCSTSVTVSSLPTTAADTNVRYYATATAPGALWEVNAGVVTRLGVVQSGGVLAAYPQASGSEAAVRAASAANGSWWYGAGSEGTGIYLRPIGDVATSKTIEVSNADVGVTITGADLTMRGVQLSFGRNNTLSVARSNASATDCLFKHSGTSDGVAVNERVNWRDDRCIFEDSGDDGLNTNGSGAKTTSIGSIFQRNIGDGFAPHNSGNDCQWIGCQFLNNGKQGMVTVGQGSYFMQGCEARGNADTDILYLIDIATASTLVMQDNVADECKISTASQVASYITGRVTGHRGPIEVQANIDIRGHRGPGGLRVVGGAVTLRDFHYSGVSGSGLRIDAGSLDAQQGHILRCTIGIDQNGGTLTLDAANPVNVYDNATQFDGVSSGDQAKTVSIAAV